jgi:hypothetical protein
MSRRPEMTESEIIGTIRDLRRHAWADPTPDDLRVPMWNAADAIRQQRREIESLKRRLARQALHLERAELDAEVMRRAAFGGQKGGAA